MTNIHALSGIRTHDLSVKAIKAYASDLAATGTVDFYPSFSNDFESMLRVFISEYQIAMVSEARTFWSMCRGKAC
jgi:hypothetical protein